MEVTRDLQSSCFIAFGLLMYTQDMNQPLVMAKINIKMTWKIGLLKKAVLGNFQHRIERVGMITNRTTFIQNKGTIGTNT